MSNGIAKVIDLSAQRRPAREIDLLSEFYDAWKHLHQRRHEGAEREEMEGLGQDLLEAYTAIEVYRNRHKKNGQ